MTLSFRYQSIVVSGTILHRFSFKTEQYPLTQIWRLKTSSRSMTLSQNSNRTPKSIRKHHLQSSATQYLSSMSFLQADIKANHIPGSKRNMKHTAAGIPTWSPTVVLICRSTAYVWQSGRDAQFSADCGRMCLNSRFDAIYINDMNPLHHA
jgi:hypothetical protein